MIFFVYFHNLAHSGQKVIYTSNHDHSLKNLLKGSSAPADLFGKQPFCDMLKALDDAVAEEEVEPAVIQAEEFSTFLPEGWKAALRSMSKISSMKFRNEPSWWIGS